VFLWLTKRIFAIGPLGRAQLFVEHEGGAQAPPIQTPKTSETAGHEPDQLQTGPML